MAGADLVGIAKPKALTDEADDLAGWLNHRYNGAMSWLAEDVDIRNDPSKLLDGCRSIIVIAVNYYTPQLHLRFPNFPRISRYAWGRDYHKVVRNILKETERRVDELALKSGIADSRYLGVVDTAPFRDKVWAQRAGLGWIGKHSILITRQYGSWVFLGALLTTLDLEPDAPHESHCGKCQKCRECCPTGAILEGGQLNARACISYLTIEHPGHISSRYIPHLSGWVYGCDTCQDVCPWNRFAKPTKNIDFEPREGLLVPDLQMISMMTDDEYDKLTTGTALRRSGRERLRRNALVVMGLLE